MWKKSYFHLVLVAYLLGLAVASCNKGGSLDGVYDQAFVIRGLVLDSTTSSKLAGVIVGFRNPTVSDSLVFAADSLLPLTEHTVPIQKQSLADGSFELNFFPGIRDTSRYKYLFAYKSGYQLWRFDQAPTNINQINQLLDQLEVKLIPR